MAQCKKSLWVVAVITFTFSLLVSYPVSANVDESKSLEVKIREWDEQGIDPNHSQVMKDIRSYIDENIEYGLFSSLHIDREERDLGVIVVSFTEQISDADKQAMINLLNEHAEIAFRVVTYTEEELVAKQQDIDFGGLESEGITVIFTSVDIIDNQVEVGITPYNEKNVETIADKFGKDMIDVVEAEPLSTMGEDTANTVEEESAQENERNIFQKIWSAIASFFANLF